MDSHQFCCTDPEEQKSRPDSPEYWSWLSYVSEDMVKKKLFILQTRASMGTQITLHRRGSKVLASHIQD